MSTAGLVSNNNLPGRIPRLSEEPEIVKFARIDAAQWEWDWAPEKYDPLKAKTLFESHIEEIVEAEELGFDGLFLTEHHFDGWTVLPSPNIFLTVLAVKTKRLRLGTAVHVLSIHSPVRLAEGLLYLPLAQRRSNILLILRRSAEAGLGLSRDIGMLFIRL